MVKRETRIPIIIILLPRYRDSCLLSAIPTAPFIKNGAPGSEQRVQFGAATREATLLRETVYDRKGKIVHYCKWDRMLS